MEAGVADVTLTGAAERYRNAYAAHQAAQDARKDAHRAHVDARTAYTRKAHYKACENAARRQRALDRARDELVAAALEATT